jgi:hypothetical protein
MRRPHLWSGHRGHNSPEQPTGTSAHASGTGTCNPGPRSGKRRASVLSEAEGVEEGGCMTECERERKDECEGERGGCGTG